MLRTALRTLVLVPVAAGVVIATVFAVRGGGRITVEGLTSDAPISADRLAGLEVRITAKGVAPNTLHAYFDYTPVKLVQDGDSYVIRPPRLVDGRHRLQVVGDGARIQREFTVDTTSPALDLSVPTEGVRLHQPVTITGKVDAGARVSADGGTVKRGDDGAFRIDYPAPPTNATVTATDTVGNTTRRTVTVPVSYPGQVRAIHLTGYAWAYQPYRDSALKLVREKRINAVQLDVKEDDGVIGTDLDVPLAKQVNAITKKYDITEAVRTLHAAGARVIGRVVAFRDPVLAKWAWQHGRKDWVVQMAGGGPYDSGRGDPEFTNFANPDVQRYNLDVAEAAVRAGVDVILFDHVNRPAGRPSTIRFAGLDGSAERAIADFCGRARQRLHAAGGYVGAAIFAQAVLHPEDTAQNVPEMARNLDMVVPLAYPNQWSAGSYGVAKPASDTYQIVRRSLADWVQAVHGTGASVVPWLWASDAGGSFSVRQAADEIRGARENGLPGWFLWNAEAHYEKWAPALSPDAAPIS